MPSRLASRLLSVSPPFPKPGAAKCKKYFKKKLADTACNVFFPPKSSSCPHFHLLFRFKKQSAAPIIRGHIWERRKESSHLLFLLPVFYCRLARCKRGEEWKKSAAVSPPPSAMYYVQRFNKPAAAATNRASVFYDAFSCSHRNLLLF